MGLIWTATLLSTVQNIDLDTVFAYPLTPVPLSLAHVNSSINKTDKSKLFQKLEGMVDSTCPPELVDVVIVDAMFLFHTLLNLPAIYGEIAQIILSRLCEMHHRINLVCDTHQTPSIKDTEHTRRGGDEAVYTIT